jgi:hypothetical protein
MVSATNRPLRHSQTVPATEPSFEQQPCSTCTPSIVRTVIRHVPFIQHNQTLIVIVVFLVVFVLLFLVLLITLMLCRRKLRHHLTAELQRQRSHHHYYYHTRLHPPMVKATENNGITGANDSLYEQLPSLSSDSELPFLYNEKRSGLVNGPMLPPQPPTFRQHFCCHSTGHILPASMSNSHEYQYATNLTTTTGYSTPTTSQHQCGAVFLWANRLLSPAPHAYNHRPCTLHSSPSELQHLQQCLLSNHSDQISTAPDSHRLRYFNNETVFIPTATCPCLKHVQTSDTYIYPHTHG